MKWQNCPDELNINDKPVMYVLLAGLTPMLPTIEVVPVLDIPVFARIVKSPAVPRFTGDIDTGASFVNVTLTVIADPLTVTGLAGDTDVTLNPDTFPTV
jgi:hypothetical protein